MEERDIPSDLHSLFFRNLHLLLLPLRLIKYLLFPSSAHLIRTQNMYALLNHMCTQELEPSISLTSAHNHLRPEKAVLLFLPHQIENDIQLCANDP